MTTWLKLPTFLADHSAGPGWGTEDDVLGDPGVDYPEEKAVVDVIAGSRGEVLMSWVEQVGEDELVITAPRNKTQQSVSPEVGEHLELVWRGPNELRSLPAALVGVDSSADPRWRLRATGPAGRGQRRAAVRAPIPLPVHVERGTRQLEGTVVDLSEGGLRCVVDLVTDSPATDANSDGEPSTALAADESASPTETAPAALEVGDLVQVSVPLDGGRISCAAEVVRRHRRQDARTEVSIRFIGVSEYTEDLIRRHVFATLRDMRQRGLI